MLALPVVCMTLTDRGELQKKTNKTTILDLYGERTKMDHLCILLDAVL